MYHKFHRLYAQLCIYLKCLCFIPMSSNGFVCPLTVHIQIRSKEKTGAGTSMKMLANKGNSK